MRAGFAPRAPHGGRSTPPKPPANDVSVTMNASIYASGMPESTSLAAARHRPEACAPDAWHTITSNQGSQGRSPGPGVQGARPPLAAARAGHLHLAEKSLPPPAQGNCTLHEKCSFANGGAS